MRHYTDTDNDSGVDAYQIFNNGILVKFKQGKYRYYEYTYGSAGSHHVERMKDLAQRGDGLNAYIIENDVQHASRR